MNLFQLKNAIRVVFFLISNISYAQTTSVILSGGVKDKNDKAALSFANVFLKAEKDSSFVTGTVTDDEGFFTLTDVKPGNYLLEVKYFGYKVHNQAIYIGNLSDFLNLPTIEMEENTTELGEILVTAKQDEVGGKMDRKSYSVEDNVAQGGGSVFTNHAKSSRNYCSGWQGSVERK